MTAHASPRRIVGTAQAANSVRQPTLAPTSAEVPAELVGWAPGPITLAPTFRCGACDNPRSPKGRRLRRVRGLRTWVCGVCDFKLSK